MKHHCRALMLALVATLVGSASSAAPPCGAIGACGKPTSPFPKLDKAACMKKYPTVSSVKCDMDNTAKKVCASGGKAELFGKRGTVMTFPNKCALEAYICFHLMGPSKDPPPEYLFDGSCTRSPGLTCPACSSKPNPDRICTQVGDTASKATLRVFRSHCDYWISSACAIPTLKVVKMSVCAANGVTYKEPSSPLPSYEYKCKEQMKKCNPKMQGAAVCGDDKQTYADLCTLYFQNCMQMGRLGRGAKVTKLASQGACPTMCDATNKCPTGQQCVGTCVPKDLDKCGSKQCQGATECREVMQCKKGDVTGVCPTTPQCVPKSAKPTCNINAMANCVREAEKGKQGMAECGVLVAQTSCALNTNCLTTAQRLCNSGVMMDTGTGRSRLVLPKNCNAPACPKAVDKNCKVADYRTCRAAAMQQRSTCGAYQSMATCIATTKCTEDLEATCYMAKMDGCTHQSLKDACKASQSPIKELSSEHERVFGYARLTAEGSSRGRSTGHSRVVAGGMACTALVAVVLAAMAVRRRRRTPPPGEAPTADYRCA